MSSCVQRQLWQIEFVSTTELNLPLLGVQVLQHRLIHLLECRCLFLSFLMTVAGLTCNTRAVSRIPTVPIALLAFRRRAMAHNIRALAVGAWSTCVSIVARYHTGGSVPLRHPSRMADQQICNTFPQTFATATKVLPEPATQGTHRLVTHPTPGQRRGHPAHMPVA
jgi:hypothetical protein